MLRLDRTLLAQWLLAIFLALAGVTFASAEPMEYGWNRPGGDYAHFPLTVPLPGQCRAACAGDATCKSWTFVKPGIQGPLAQCWLKSVVKPKVADSCCVSGAKPVPAGGAIESNTDRPGSDYTSVTLPAGSKAKACRALCNADAACKAWTYVKAGIQATNPRCWLKDSIPPKVSSSCCSSGVK